MSHRFRTCIVAFSFISIVLDIRLFANCQMPTTTTDPPSTTHSSSDLPRNDTIQVPSDNRFHLASKYNDTALNERTSASLRPHPHAGARDAEGNWGYVADVTAVRRWMQRRCNTTTDSTSCLPINELEVNQVCHTPAGKRVYETLQAFDLLRGVHLGAPERNALTVSDPPLRTPQNDFSNKILCALYTHKGAHDKVTGIAETWGWRCDGFFAASDETVQDPASLGFGAIDLAHAGNETRYVTKNHTSCATSLRIVL